MSLFLGYSSGFLQVYHYLLVLRFKFQYALADAPFSPFRRGDALLRAPPSGASGCHIMTAFRTVTVTDD